MSNLGGGVGLGLSGDYATTYSSYNTIEQSYAIAGQNIFKAAGCTQADLQAQIACLGELDALKVVGLDAVARYVVQDGMYVNTEHLIVAERNRSTAHVPVIFGWCSFFLSYHFRPSPISLPSLTCVPFFMSFIHVPIPPRLSTRII